MKYLVFLLVALIPFVAAQITPTPYAGTVFSNPASPIPAAGVKVNLNNFVLQWSATIPAMTRQFQPGLFNSTRISALVHIAMYDTIQAFEKTFAQYQTGLPAAPAKASIQAAITGAASTIFHSYFGNMFAENAKYSQIMNQQLAVLQQNGVSQNKISNGFNFGQAVANALLNSRASDGYNTLPPFVPQQGPGFYRPTPPNFPNPLGNGWGAVTPWGLSNPIRSYFPPDGNTYFTNGSRYVNDYFEVLGRGRETFDAVVSPVKRTGIETFIGTFFDNDNFGTSLPPSQYLTGAQGLGISLGLSTANFSRMLAYVALANANANIGAWAVKYTFQEWRPVAAIREAGTDNYTQTVPDPNWFPVSVTSPPFPDYVSGHGTFGFTVAQALRRFLNSDNARIFLLSDNMPVVSVTYNQLSNFAMDNAMSRIFLGCHFRAAALDTQFLGEPMANDVANRLLLPL